MNMIKRNFMEAITFYGINKWLTLFCVIGLIFTTDISFFNGLRGVCYNIGVMSMLLCLIMFFRLGCTKRHLFDIEDIFRCLFHVLLMDLHYYLSAYDYYEISKGRKCANFFYRLFLGGVFIGSAVIFMSLSEEISNKREIHPVYAIIWFVLCVVVNFVVSAFIERRYNKFYDANKLFKSK